MADYLMGSVIVACCGVALAVMLLAAVRRHARNRRAALARDRPRQLRDQLRSTDELIEKINKATSDDELDRLEKEQ
jgi:hypothetical protein